MNPPGVSALRRAAVLVFCLLFCSHVAAAPLLVVRAPTGQKPPNLLSIRRGDGTGIAQTEELKPGESKIVARVQEGLDPADLQLEFYYTHADGIEPYVLRLRLADSDRLDLTIRREPYTTCHPSIVVKLRSKPSGEFDAISKAFSLNHLNSTLCTRPGSERAVRETRCDVFKYLTGFGYYQIPAGYAPFCQTYFKER